MRRIALAVALLVALPAFGEPQQWKQLMIWSTDALKAGGYRKALRIDDRVIEEMMGWLGKGDSAAASLAIVVTHRALALAGLGRNDDAIWAWHEAIAIRPSIVNSDLGEFGAPGAFLKAHLAQPFIAPRITGDIIAPVARRRVEPRYPAGARALGIDGITIIGVLVDRTGSVRDVEALKTTESPTITYSIMEAARDWHFDPATRNGEPLDVTFSLTMSMKLH